LGIGWSISGWQRPFIAPQSEWPQTTMSLTPSARMAYSIADETPPFRVENGGTILPALRQTKSSPGPDCVMVSGITRLSAHDIIKACGCWPSRASLR
jgi:hypothetical protein